MKSAGKARSNGLYRHIRTSKEIIRNLLNDYYKKQIFDFDPFVRVDENGVGKLINMAVKDGRSVKENLKIGVCGEQAGDPKSIEFFYNAGVNYVSCSPYRIPISRLAASQVYIKNKR